MLVSAQVRLYDGGAVVVPQVNAEIRNEGAPFRCLGLHTHRKVRRKRKLVSARNPATSILQDWSLLQHSRHYRQAKYDSQNLFNIAIREPWRQPLRRNRESLKTAT